MSIFKYGWSFAILWIKLSLLKEKRPPSSICYELYHDMTCILKYWEPGRNEAREDVQLTSPGELLLVQQFLASFGMHLERTSENAQNRVFKIVPNWE